MKKILLSITLCAVLILVNSGLADAKHEPPTDPGGLFLVDIDDERVVLQYWGSEQEWQYSSEETFGWWEGLSPHPFGHKIWYPDLKDTFDRTLAKQLEWIEDLEYAGIDKWRIGYFWDTTPLKASLFGGLDLGVVNKSDYNTYVYFPPTACGPSRMDMIVPGALPYGCMTLGRTGNEEGAKTGALINPMDLGMNQTPPDPPGPKPPNERYLAEGDLVRQVGFFPGYHTLDPSEAQDHWMNFYKYGPPYDTDTNPVTIWYNDDLNYNTDDDTIGLMSPVDGGDQPIGAWTVTEKWPVLDSDFAHEIAISAVEQPDGTKVPVENLRVRHNNGAPEALISFDDGSAIVTFPAESEKKKPNVYHIDFSHDGVSHTFKVTTKTTAD